MRKGPLINGEDGELRIEVGVAIAEEICRGVPNMKPTHPQLYRDIRNAWICVSRSPTFRAAVIEYENHPNRPREP